MNKTLKMFFISLFTLVLLSIGKYVSANSIDNISMDIFIDNNGNASVTEVWKCRTNKGTEVYHPYYNLGNSKIKDLSVTDGSKNYTTLSTWNTSGTLESKANKCGINNISNGVELCWGISSYGTHTYTVKYTITNFVSQLKDSQMIYWTLIPYDFSDEIGNVYIKIHTGFYIPESVGVWGYGNYGGTAYVYNGYIEMQSDGKLDKDEYMTILVQFPSDTFETANNINHDFSYYLNMANEGATNYNKSSVHNSVSSAKPVFITLLNIFISFVPFFVIILILSNKSTRFDFGTYGKNIPKDVPYFRDIPCNKDLFRAYYISEKYGLFKNKTDIFGALILKWVKESKIQIEKRESKNIFKKENTVLILNSFNVQDTNSKEYSLFKMLREASKDGVLENKEFEKWCKSNYSSIFSWFDSVMEIEQEKLVSEGLITYEEKTQFKIFKSKRYIATPELRNEALQIAGLKKYLLDYTLIPDREAIDVHLFEDYLIFAQMLGIAKSVAKQFSDLYPDIIEQSSFNSYDNIMFMYMYSSNIMSVASSAKSRAESYSSGGGGFSSGGGGGGSFGGGGGGGGFR